MLFFIAVYNMRRTNLFRQGAVVLSCLAALGLAASCEKPLKDLAFDFNGSAEVSSAEIRQGETLEIPFTVAESAGAALVVSATTDNAGYTASVKMSVEQPSEGVLTIVAPTYVLEPATIGVEITAVDDANARTVKKSFSVEAKMAETFVELTEPSNSYIVAPGSFVKFPANVGNTSETVNYASVKLVWQDVKGLVNAVVPASDKGAVYADLSEGISGNAVVAACDDSGKVLWSWHLWVCSYDPAAKPMVWSGAANNLAGESVNVSYTIMDRNLGATSSESGTDAANGNFYQWGRKDPFPGSALDNKLKVAYDIEGNKVEKTVVPVAAENNIQNAIENPYTHYSGVNSGNWGWISTTKSFLQSDEVQNLWGYVSGTKSKYDPCPAGWEVGPIEAWYFYSDASVVKEKVYDSTGETANKNLLGRNVTVGADKFFFPSQGEIPHGGSYSYGPGSTYPCGKSWSSSPDKANNRAWGTSVSPPSASPKTGYSFGYALPVRCVKSK